MMPYRFQTLAQFDYFDLLDWYDAIQAGLGDDFADDFEAFLNGIRGMPRTGTRVSRPPRGREVRYGMTRRFVAIVYYEVTATEVVILSVQHYRSNRRPWRRRLNTP